MERWQWSEMAPRVDTWVWTIIGHNEASDLQTMLAPMHGGRVVTGAPPIRYRDRRDRSLKKNRPRPFTATCWCERDFVVVTPADVKAGRTVSCGHRRCRPC